LRQRQSERRPAAVACAHGLPAADVRRDLRLAGRPARRRPAGRRAGRPGTSRPGRWRRPPRASGSDGRAGPAAPRRAETSPGPALSRQPGMAERAARPYSRAGGAAPGARTPGLACEAARVSFTRADYLRGAEFTGADLRGARFAAADLSGVVMRGVDVSGADIDSPWLGAGDAFLRVNGIDVVPLVEAELNRRFPGRADRHAADPEGLRTAWDVLQRAWAATLDRVAAMPAGIADVSVGGEWSFAQTLRHLVFATDVRPG